MPRVGNPRYGGRYLSPRGELARRSGWTGATIAAPCGLRRPGARSSKRGRQRPPDAARGPVMLRTPLPCALFWLPPMLLGSARLLDVVILSLLLGLLLGVLAPLHRRLGPGLAPAIALLALGTAVGGLAQLSAEALGLFPPPRLCSYWGLSVQALLPSLGNPGRQCSDLLAPPGLSPGGPSPRCAKA